jgi:RNA polymerase sigma factor (sigma-70 family)
MALAGKFEKMYATRRSLLSRVKNPEDHESWTDFYDTYSRLVYSVAMKAGLTNTEAEEAVQETFIALTRKMPKFKYDPAIGSFKNWLIKTTRFKVGDQFRKRKRQLPAGSAHGERTEKRTATIDRIPDPASLNLNDVCEAEWRELVFARAVEKLKELVPPNQFQIFDLYVLKKWPVKKVATALGISNGRIYLTKHRLAQLVKREMKVLEETL